MPKTTQKKFVTNQLVHTLVEELAKGQFVAKILASRGNNLHQVETSNGEIFLISMPTRFRRTLWVRRGNFVIAQPIEEGDKVKAEIVHVLDNENICYLIEKGEWPERFLKEIKSIKGIKRIDENGKELKEEEKDLMFPSMSSSEEDDEEEEEEEADEADNEDNDNLEEANNDEKK